MEILRPNFSVGDDSGNFSDDELRFIDDVVNEMSPKNEARLKSSIMRKVGAKSWPSAIALLFKFGVVKALCVAMALTLSMNEVTHVSFVEMDSKAIVRLRNRRELEGV